MKVLINVLTCLQQPLPLGATAENLMDLDLAYAPPFATTKDPVMYSGMIIQNDLFRGRKILSAKQVLELIESNQSYTIIDTRIPTVRLMDMCQQPSISLMKNLEKCFIN